MLGYARVSTQDQDLSAQLAALKTAGAATIFREKISGIRADRPQLAKLMASLSPGDIVIVTKLDRLGRSTRELLDLIHRIDQAGASFKSLGDPLFDTSSPQGRLLVTMLAAGRRLIHEARLDEIFGAGEILIVVFSAGATAGRLLRNRWRLLGAGLFNTGFR